MEQPTVKISTGVLRGKTGTSSHNRKFYSFQGIPYAKPPLGVLRFKAPVPPVPWSGIKDATEEGSDCFHFNPVLKTLQGSEDCLTLNVYTPTLPSNATRPRKKPVMVWIHGGAFTSGSGSSIVYGPEFLMNEDIVLVTINYRIGLFGFLSLEDPSLDVPGNAGLKDMVMALKWVQENITFFDGNPNNVTIFGESAGGAAVHYLILSPLARGLFHKAIMQSGCALNNWARGRRCARELAQVLGLKSFKERDILKVLQSLTPKEIYKAASKLPDELDVSVVRPHGPVIERNLKGAFISEDPKTIIKSGKYNHVPIIIGYTNREGMLGEAMQKPKPFKPHTDFQKSIPFFLNMQRDSSTSQQIARQIKEFYYGNETPSTINKDKYYLLESDNFFVREILEAVHLHLNTSYAPIYLYRMSLETNLNMMKKIAGITEPGTCHGDDLGYLFKNALTPEFEQHSPEQLAVTRYTKLWTNFAKYGDPNNKEFTCVLNIEWEPVTHQKMNFLEIGNKLLTGTNPDADRMLFWKDIFNTNPASKL